MAGFVCAFSFSDFRNVFGCSRQLLVSAFRLKAQYSSCSKSLGSRRGPCSSTTTRNPFEDSSFARTPPAAPDPTITKSTTSVVLYLAAAAITRPISYRRAVRHRSSRKAARTCQDSQTRYTSSPARDDSLDVWDCRENRGLCIRAPDERTPWTPTFLARQTAAPLSVR